ncbi:MULTISPECIES: c-type cytochrome biogenesis protein CcmI [unclassified Roseovarius]|uniref:c-type cytochrome biogenesis protein CcmI n=1 Tax=unclassified Roseovarius TaxID=2614913 RepID=UPI00273D3375|nr:c-type cytochrome biogenesis protein CcmI [Roseovarius sp. MMSF_3350]
MTFWVLAIALGLACAAVLGLVLFRGRVGDAPPAAYDLQVYRDQLKEVDRDLARGVITPEDAERTRSEVSRRILAADAQLQATGQAGARPALPGKLFAALALLGLVAGAGWLYTQMGAPGYADMPRTARLAASDTARANRLPQDEAEARFEASQPVSPDMDKVDPQYLELMERLREAVESRPDELQGYVLLARNEAALGNLSAAAKAKGRVIELKGDAATAGDYAELADMMISAAGGYVSADAAEAIRAALAHDPAEPRARYYMGLYMIQVDRPDIAFRTWDRLLRESAPDAPWTALIRPRIEELAWRAGINRYEPPAENAAPGPSQGDIDAAGDMSAEDRAAMIRGMVDRLATRIEETGGTEGEWVRLSNAYAVLGDFDAVRDLLARAQDRFDDPMVIDTITNAAKQAGYSE